MDLSFSIQANFGKEKSDETFLWSFQTCLDFYWWFETCLMIHTCKDISEMHTDISGKPFLTGPFNEWDMHKSCSLHLLNAPAAHIWLAGHDLQLTAYFSLKFRLGTNLKTQITREPSGYRLLDFFRCRVSSVAARHTVIDYTTSTLLWIYSQRHRLWLNDNDPDKQLKSVFAARTQHMSDSNDREG